ncbi:MAG: hypothetical protein POELPBGB_03898 [Bacteroidia bacterium]|nr:hypothetical protein [Bacteroidia bacterium]
MVKSIKYKYRYRPGHSSGNFLIEFISGVENENFVFEVLEALKDINPKVIRNENILMNDDILYTIESSLGQFTLSKDNYDVAFIISDNNQTCIEEINNLLSKDNRFEITDLINKNSR